MSHFHLKIAFKLKERQRERTEIYNCDNNNYNWAAITTPWPERQTLNSIFVDKYSKRPRERGRQRGAGGTDDIRAKQSCHYIMTLMTNWRRNAFDVCVVWLFLVLIMPTAAEVVRANGHLWRGQGAAVGWCCCSNDFRFNLTAGPVN